MGFQVIFTYETESRGYVSDVPELPGCMSQGKTLDEAVKNIKDAIKGYLYVQKKHNRKIKDIESESALPTLSCTGA
jgi:predicted RNase H-like HicB family nuclease